MAAQERLRNNLSARSVSNHSNSSLPGANSRNNNRKSVHFNSIRSQHRYVPALREGEVEDEDDEWETDGFEDEDPDLVVDPELLDEDDAGGMGFDDVMVWESGALENPQFRQPLAGEGAFVPDALQPASLREQQQQQMLRAQQQQQLQQQQEELLAQQQHQQQLLLQQRQMEAERQQAQQQADTQKQQQETLRHSDSREQLDQDAQGAQKQASRHIDPAEVTETRKVTATPTIAREYNERPTGQPFLPSIIVEEERKRVRDDDSSDESTKKKIKGKDKLPLPVSSSTYYKPQPAKLRKERSSNSGGESTDDEGKEKKKKGSMFGGLFGRNKKEKGKDKNNTTASISSVESSESLIRGDEPARPREGISDGTISPTTVAAQQQQQALNLRNAATQMEQGASAPSTPDRSTSPQVSVAHSLRQRDQQHQALYQQYLNRSPSSPPEAQLSYGLQAASAVLLNSPSNSALGPPQPRPRPGSLIITSASSVDGQANLNVIRVFAGKHLQTEATFKTVLLNSSTTSADLVRQALQRFRLPSSEIGDNYYLTVKQVEGGAFAVLEPHEKPLVVFETLVNETMELPKLNRNSVGSISSIASNLSMHPAIRKLSMNDFTDDSSVKFYLNRRTDDPDDSTTGHEDDDTIKAESSFEETDIPQKIQYLSSMGLNLSFDRFTSPSIRFPLQVVIYAEDLPDEMQFHPTTEAIVYKSSLADPNSPVLVSPTLRRKIFLLPKNVTVAEVTEIGLERFGIQDGVVDGGDEVEDKTTKRRSGIRIRYSLTVNIEGNGESFFPRIYLTLLTNDVQMLVERELVPSSKIVDAYSLPPQYRNVSPIGASKRRSLDPSLVYGSIEDVRPDDPVFVIRRATSYRTSTSRRRSSVPLDEIALSKIHRESSSSYNSDTTNGDEGKLKQPSPQEIIAAQRAVTRATQHAIVSAQSNSVRGMDVLLPGNAMLRSSRYDADEKMRYSYVEPDGETYDISDIIEEEWRETDNDNDLLKDVFIRNKDGIGERLDRFINKIRKGKQKEKESSNAGSDAHSLMIYNRSVSPSEYSIDTEIPSRSVTPSSAGLFSKLVNGIEQNARGSSRPGTVTPTGGMRTIPNNHNRCHSSINSVTSDYSSNSTPPQSNLSCVGEENGMSMQTQPRRRVVLPKDDFGLSQMMSIIEFKALKQKMKESSPPHPVDEFLFGVPIDIDSLHPAIREIYGPALKQFEEIDKVS